MPGLYPQPKGRNTPLRAPSPLSSSSSSDSFTDFDDYSTTTNSTAASSVATSPKRDPHVLPTFDEKTLTEPRDTVLYLPPLISSLPIALQPPSSKPSPLTTATRLPDIDPASLSLHRALHHFRPVTEEYASTPYAEAFNWDELRLPENDEREWYVVAFRSKRKSGSESGPLYDADAKAHEEAIQNGGLLMYWYGVPHAQSGVNLATCIWQSRKHAVAANSRPHHIKAMRLAATSYEMYDLERYTLKKVRGEEGLRVESFHGGEVGW
ncbi:hypothetical protein JAAARDRAFT_58200 [Jaapia argillacea MUCL 33604]|uniref:Uncharacterized protein n=1 Tax=Jaapia argillacea MUCL 33604 TaxID=933084 RepID=A0A067Q298_9AGAM|nr:hypothetical protein JAAARDRAFT_58200 [Jaapia argillacea MUCL 33604]